MTESEAGGSKWESYWRFYFLDSSCFSMNWDIFFWRRINGINVYEFWIGMGPTLAHKKIGEYRLLSENTADRRCVCDGGR